MLRWRNCSIDGHWDRQKDRQRGVQQTGSQTERQRERDREKQFAILPALSLRPDWVWANQTLSQTAGLPPPRWDPRLTCNTDTHTHRHTHTNMVLYNTFMWTALWEALFIRSFSVSPHPVTACRVSDGYTTSRRARYMFHLKISFEWYVDRLFNAGLSGWQNEHILKGTHSSPRWHNAIFSQSNCWAAGMTHL